MFTYWILSGFLFYKGIIDPSALCDETAIRTSQPINKSTQYVEVSIKSCSTKKWSTDKQFIYVPTLKNKYEKISQPELIKELENNE